MEQQTKGLIAFDELKALPDVLTANETSLSKAKNAVQPLIDTWAGIDLSNANADEVEALDKQLADAQYKLTKTIEMMEERRKPGTRRLDEIKKRFTTIEGEVKGYLQEIAGSRNLWQAEKSRRHQAEENARGIKIKQDQEAIERKAAQDALVFKEQTFLINSTVERMIAKYNSLPADGLDEYCDKLAKLDVVAMAEAKMLSGFKGIFISAMNDNLVELLEQKESRKAELIRDADAAAKRVAKEAAERKASQELQAFNDSIIAHQQAEAAKLNAQFETLAQPIETPDISSGTVVKKKYKVTSHGGHVMLLRWWTQNIMVNMSLDELQKKLSFVRTSCDKALNQGEVIEGAGLEVVIDYATRSSKSE